MNVLVIGGAGCTGVSFVPHRLKYYALEYERCIRWNDSSLGIDWYVNELSVLSAKDQQGALFAQIEVFN